MDNAHSLPVEKVAEYFQVDLSTGITTEQTKENLSKYGRNALPEDEKTPLWKMVLEQFQDQLVIILLIAAIISFVLAFFEEEKEGEAFGSAFVEPIVILLILIANATVGVIQESNAEKAIEALKKYSPDEAKVLRGGHLHKIDAEELVPGTS
jgi:P-type Ca2+ transporter type 2A